GCGEQFAWHATGAGARRAVGTAFDEHRGCTCSRCNVVRGSSCRPGADDGDVDLSNSHFASSFMWRAVAKAPPHVEKTTEGKNDPGRDTRSLMPPVKRAARETSISGLAVLHLRVADARILRWARECVALLDRNLVFRLALRYGRVLACVRLLRRRILARIGHDAVDLGVGLGLDQRGV